jgi:hypothetical protein
MNLFEIQPLKDICLLRAAKPRKALKGALQDAGLWSNPEQTGRL